MKRFFYLIVCTVLISCEDPKVLPKEYPFVVMEGVKVHKDSVEFIGKITDLGDLSITGHGFLWSEGQDIDSSNLFSKIIESPVSMGRFAMIVQSDIQTSKRYTVRPFVLTENLTVVGNSITFIGEGSLKPMIKDFYPKTGYFGDTITISGSNFSLSESRTMVLFGTEQANVISVNNDQIKVVLPQNISEYGDVKLRIKSGEHIVSSNENFTLAGHQILGFSPNSGYIGEAEITINTSYFEGIGSKVRVGGFDATVLKESNNEIRVRLPYSMEVGDALIEVEINGNSAYSETNFAVKSRWSQLSNFQADPRVRAYFGIINDEGYLIGGSKAPDDGSADFDEVWRYDFTSDQWQMLGAFPNGAREMAIGFSINEKIYYGGGHLDIIEPSFDFWEFNPVSKLWKQLDDLPLIAEDVVSFTLNKKGYVIQSHNNEVWEFDPLTKKWTSIGYISYDICIYSSERDLYFQSNEKAYFCPIFSSATNSYILYEFDPSDPNLLTPITNLPFSSDKERYLSGFVIDNEIFIGNDDYYDEDVNQQPEFWKYDMLLGSWQRIETFLGGERSLANSFSKDGFGYVFFGLDRICCSPMNTEFSSTLWKYNPEK